VTEAECRQMFEYLMAGCRHAPIRLRVYDTVGRGLEQVTRTLLAELDDFEKVRQLERSN
jgi:hypothetical protein